MKKPFKAFLALALLSVFQTSAYPEVIDRVVAFIDDGAITLSELEASYAEAVKINPDITKHEVLNTMVNRFFLLREAKRLRIEAPTDEQLLEEYINIRVKAFIKVSETDIRKFYDKKRGDFSGLKFSDVKDRIKTYLQEKEVNQRLKQHIEELKANSYIKILLD